MAPIAFVDGHVVWRCDLCGREDVDGDDAPEA
jgi:prepilin-type processing-associated H-X9-DG protein